MGSALRFMFLDDFDPLTNHLYLRVAYHDGRDGVVQAGFQILRQSVNITETLPLESLQREFRRVLKTPMPPLWFDYLKLVVHALGLELKKMKTNEKPNLWWVGVQCFHPIDPGRSTLHFEIAQQVDILKEWIFQMEEEKDEVRYIEFLSRALLMAPQDPALLRRMVFYLKQTSQLKDAYELTKRWLLVNPDEEEALCIKAAHFLRKCSNQLLITGFTSVPLWDPFMMLRTYLINWVLVHQKLVNLCRGILRFQIILSMKKN
ncbi:MAG: hypothetical protein RL124_813 [Acidobacteriota bacterium]